MTDEDTAVLACDPEVCGLGRQPHKHCICGLPMAMDDDMCALCRLEEADPKDRRSRVRAEDPYAWDGCSYPSRRRRRVRCDEEEPYRLLLFSVLRADEPDVLRLGGDRVQHPGVLARRRQDGSLSADALRLADQLRVDRAGVG
jgi:hypothetical protein